MPYFIRVSKKHIPIIFTLILAPFFFAHGQAISTASTDALQSDFSRLTESLELLNAIKAGKRPTDVTSLQTALNSVISISNEELRSVSIRLAAQDNLTDDETALRDSLVADLANLKTHIKSVHTDTTQETGTSAVIWIAEKFKEWRDGPYATVMERTVRFVSVFENEDSVKAANARLISIMKDQKKIRSLLSAVQTTSFMRLIKKAQGELKKAADLNARAKASLVHNPDAENEKEDEADLTDEIIRQSAKLINDAYNDFIAMSKLIRK